MKLKLRPVFYSGGQSLPNMDSLAYNRLKAYNKVYGLTAAQMLIREGERKNPKWTLNYV